MSVKNFAKHLSQVKFIFESKFNNSKIYSTLFSCQITVLHKVPAEKGILPLNK